MSEIELKAVIFDLDGVVVDSESTYDQVFNSWMWQQGFDYALQDKINAALVPGLTWADVFTTVNQIAKTKLNVKGAQDQITKMVVQHILDVGIPLKEGARDALTVLSERYMIGLASSSPAKVVERALRHHALFETFKHITTIEDVTHGKPNPEPYQKTMAALGVLPEETIVIEDSLAGAKAGAAAGAFVYALPDHRFRDEQFVTIAKVVHSFPEILADLL